MRDHLMEWYGIREQIPWSLAARDVQGPVPGHRDGMRDFADGEGPGMAAALERARADAATEVPLTFSMLAGWQALVLGMPEAGFRDGPAHAKGGRETYGLHPDTRQRFSRCLAEAMPGTMPLAARAARVYLDVAFFHPFADGNARAALLCLDFVLQREEVTVDLVAPLRVVRRADDPEGALDLVRLVDVLIAGTRRRAAPAVYKPCTGRLRSTGA